MAGTFRSWRSPPNAASEKRSRLHPPVVLNRVWAMNRHLLLSSRPFRGRRSSSSLHPTGEGASLWQPEARELQRRLQSVVCWDGGSIRARLFGTHLCIMYNYYTLFVRCMWGTSLSRPRATRGQSSLKLEWSQPSEVKITVYSGNCREGMQITNQLTTTMTILEVQAYAKRRQRQ